jgi:hypothetical protein
VERKGLEMAGLKLRSGLIMGDFHRWAGREGKRARRGRVNVGSSAFHEGRGAGKTDPLGGHDLVKGKKLLRRRKSYRRKSMLNLDQGKIGRVLGNDFVGLEYV